MSSGDDADARHLRPMLDGMAQRVDAASLARPLGRLTKAARTGLAALEDTVRQSCETGAAEDAKAVSAATAALDEAVKKSLSGWLYTPPDAAPAAGAAAEAASAVRAHADLVRAHACESEEEQVTPPRENTLSFALRPKERSGVERIHHPCLPDKT
jgi:hypothetical protein